ncbi:MAG TPA: EAL domain-containing protein [Telluria sp.]
MMDISASVLEAKVLIVDDAPANVKLLEYMLRGAGYTQVSSTMDSREVRALYERERHDIILLDLNMPHLDGFEVMEQLKPVETGGYLPVLVVTADPAHKVRALQAGAKDFLSKPIDHTEVLTRVRNMLEIRLLHNSLRRFNDSLQAEVSERTAELRAAEEMVGYLRNFDRETGLPNRILLRDRVRQAQDRTVHEQNVFGLLVVDLSRLDMIHGSLGIEAGREVLGQAASRLQGWATPYDTVARFGDDSFAIVTAAASAEDLGAVAEQVLALLDEGYAFEGHDVYVKACIGIAVFPDDGVTFEALEQAAVASARRAREHATQRYCYFTPELNQFANERLKLESALRRALERGEFLLHYQPQVDMASGAVTGLEALVRWRHPELGMIPPVRFIGLAEDTGLILPLGEWVLRQACLQNKAWQDAGLPKVPVGVNLSARQFAQDIPAMVRRALEESKLEPRYLELEVTESASMDNPEHTIGILERLRSMGVRLAIDDFGTGYSSLNYLKRFPVDRLKLDKSFVDDLISDPDDLAISRAVVAMAHSLRLKVVAEGVETEGQLALLADNGCDEMQGYLFSRPLDSDACTELLRKGTALAPEQRVRKPYARTLLLLDDEVNIRASIKRMLRNRGYNLLVASSAQEAFEALATTEVGVVLCDQRLPGISGTEFLSRVKYMYPSAVRMVLSGYTDLQTVTDAVNRGSIFKFLTKPWEEQELLEALDEAFAVYDGQRQPAPVV